MHEKKIAELIQQKNQMLADTGYSILNQSPLPYGKKLFIQKNNEKAALVIYWSQKKGYSFVLEGNLSTGDELISLLRGEEIKKLSGMEGFVQYVGMDESGKGDFFGPLVAAGFFLNKNENINLAKIGVKDCKKLSNSQTLEIAEFLRKEYPNHIRYYCMMPQEYNEKYAQFSEKGLKLNSLLGSMYSHLIENFESSGTKPDGYLIDRFGDEKFVLKNLSKKISLKMQIQAEADMAVAAASIIARGVFLENMTELSQLLGADIPLGAGSPVDFFAKKFIQPLPVEKQKLYVKLHFKNYLKLLG